MRTTEELAFRLKQEIGNVRLWLASAVPALEQQSPLAGLPDPDAIAERLRGTTFAEEVERLADRILEHRFPLLGVEINTGPEIRWRHDYSHHRESGRLYFRLIPYLNFSRVGDHKIVWELNRHQHLVVLAQAFRFTGRTGYLDEIRRQIVSWLAANPFPRSINWTSALEVAFRALSWTWVFHLTGLQMDPEFRREFLAGLYRHGCYLERNLSVYFSPNTHLVGEAVALHALGLLFPQFPGAGRWADEGARIVTEQMEAQIRADGSHFEQSTYYHLYAFDMFLFHRALTLTGEPYMARLRNMAEYLAALTGRERLLPMMGDEDGGRLFHPYGPRARFARASLATCAQLSGDADCSYDEEDLHEQAAWWLGASVFASRQPKTNAAPSSRMFPQAGVAVLSSGGLQVIADGGPFGASPAGHSHSDTLSMIVRLDGEELLIDPGTYTYVADPALRDWFRGSAAHNTVRIDGHDQAVAAGPFRWLGKPDVRVRQWMTSAESDFLDAECRYDGFAHRRRLLLLKPALIVFFDEVTGPGGEHELEQFWHFGAAVGQGASRCFRLGARTLLTLPDIDTAELTIGGEHGWRSEVFAARTPAAVLRIRRRSALPASFWLILDCAGGPETSLELIAPRECVYRKGGEQIGIRHEETGPPAVLRRPDPRR